MARIELLNQNTINKIAAGEVVERPASVVKELVENAIDAGATAITVEVKDGGLKLIRITDNGSGIAKDQIRTAFLRHSTSKIREATDLITIASLGFRGEALASIAAVAMVELITKEAHETTGVRFVIEGGQEKTLEDIGCPTGTTFVIRDLFYNTPARLKFMKTPSTELGYVADLINHLAMGHPEIAFKFISNGKTKIQTAGKGKLKDCIYSVYGKDVARNLLEIKGQDEGFKVHGFIGKPHISRGNRTYENYYINGRYIKSKVVERAVEDAFKSRLMLHRYPFVTFHMEVNPEEVDVNVHPTKMEVRFMKEKQVYDLIFDSIDSALKGKSMIPDVTIQKETAEKPVIQEAPEPFEVGLKRAEEKTHQQEIEIPDSPIKQRDTEIRERPPVYHTKNISIDLMASGAKKQLQETVEAMTPAPEEVVQEISPKPVAAVEQVKESINKTDQVAVEPEVTPKKAVEETKDDFYAGDQVALETTAEFINSESLKAHKVVGQLFDTYWIVELEDKYYIVDQHAAHEKILYEAMLKKIESKVAFGQRLLKPVVVQLSMQELARFEAHEKLFADLGYEVELFGEEAVIIRSVPFIFDKIFEVGQFTEILDGLVDSYSEDKYGILLDDIATMSCKAAVKGNDRLTQREYLQLIDDLLKLDDPFHCPHGRPTIVAMTKHELERKFKRIV